MFARNTAAGGIARSSAHPPLGFQTASVGDDEQMTGANSASRQSREDYEDTTFSQSQPKSTPDRYFSNTPTQSFTSPSSSKRPTRRGVSELHSKKCETIDKLNESLQGKIDRTGQKATESIEHCVDELKFKDLSDCVFTTALEHFHSHSTRTIFLRMYLNNVVVAIAIGQHPYFVSLSSNELNVPEEFYAFRDLICLELFREKMPRNTSALQGEGWVAEIMAAPHTGRGLLPHGQTSRVSSIEEVALFMQTDFVGAMDGILVPAWVPQIDQNRYRSRKGRLAQNVLAICDFDMNFIYVYVGWEGRAADARVLNHAVSQDPTFPFPPIDQ
ncbi:UNVERIFIED_CONTAM: hypothetical protein Scaly_0067300 [Sesamum calycinum]|uniref:DDE Tnp4 domain-containing protein n=1 Tax=Sesamum calycinum TaxID=2727403 RepID=A0AAW2SUI0_9LAMI